MRNKFELYLDEKLSLEARLDVLRKYAASVKAEIKKTQELLSKEACKNANQLDLEQVIEEVSAEEMSLGIGDVVEVVGYGHASFLNKRMFKTTNLKVIREDDSSIVVDINPEMIGRKGFIQKIVGGQYSLTYIHGKQAWYNKEQLKLISRNPNNEVL